MKNHALVCAALLALASSGCGGCGDKDTSSPDATPAAEATTPEATPAEPVTPADPELQKLAALMETAASLPAPGAEDRQPREAFRREALTLGNAAIGTRMDVVVGVAEALWVAGEAETAAAFLQRTVGMTRDKEVGSDHMHALARLKVELDAPLEGASLMERAIDREAASPGDFAMLSWTYLRAGRLGPGRAAVRRGLRKHPDAPELAVAGAVVMVVEGRAADALVEVASAADSGNVAALRARGEAQLASGDRAAVKATADALAKAAPENPWGPLLTAALGGPGRADALGKARALASKGLEWVDARDALDWAGAVGEGAAVWPRHPDLEGAAAPKESAPVAEKPTDGAKPADAAPGDGSGAPADGSGAP